jgi:predicted MFS family arabinose efflux permease
MAAGAFTIGCGMRIIDPLMPMMAREFGVGLDSIAPLIGGFALAYGLGQLGAGPLGDALGKLRVAAAALLFYAATLLAAPLAPDLPSLLAMRVLSGLAAAAVIPLFMAHIGDSTPYAQRQAVIGKFLTGMVMAQLLSGPISGAMGEIAGWQGAFLVLGAVAAAVAVLFAFRLGGGWRGNGGGGGAIGLGGFLRLFARPAGRRLMLAAVGDGLILFGGALPFVASLLIEDFHLSAAGAGLAAAGFGLGALAYTRAAPWLVKRLGERGMVLWGGIGLGLGLLVIALAPAWWVVAVANGTLGFTFFMLHGTLQARATEALPEARGTAVAAFAMAIFFGQSIGAVLFGALIVEAGFRPSFLVAAAAIVVLAVVIRARVIPRA